MTQLELRFLAVLPDSVFYAVSNLVYLTINSCQTTVASNFVISIKCIVASLLQVKCMNPYILKRKVLMYNLLSAKGEKACVIDKMLNTHFCTVISRP